MIFNLKKASSVFRAIRIVSGACVFLGIYVFLKETWNESKILNPNAQNQYTDSNNIGPEKIDTISSHSEETNIGNNTYFNRNILYMNSIISNETTNSNIKLINGITKFDNLSFADNKFWFHQKAIKTEDLPLSEYTNKTMRILFWTKDFGNGLLYFGRGSSWWKNLGCPIWNCEIHSDWNSSGSIPVEDFEAVIFHDPTWTNRSLAPPKRTSHQRYVFLNMEPPGFHSYLKKWNESSSFFNWTLTYRWDSDITIPYGFFRPFTDNEIRNHQTFDNYAEGKSKLVVWMASNCKAKNGRREYVKRLQRHIPVDIYGACGTLQCKHVKNNECREMIGRDYKFIIAFENSLCFDYITEKLFMNLQYNIIPIVMDLHGNYRRMAPYKSYINVLDYPSVDELADYLQELDKNDTLYNEYFWWKEHYYINQVHVRSMCGLCSKLHDPSSPVSIYQNITKWWHSDASCKVVKFPYESNDTWEATDFHPPYE